MKTIRFFSIVVGLCLSMSAMSQNSFTPDCSKAQSALMDYLRAISITPTIDTRDNSVCFKSNDVFYWVTFEENSPVLYTIHRKGLKFDEDTSFKPSCARIACDEVNRKHKIKCVLNETRVEFIMQTYAKDAADFHATFRKMLAAFNGVDTTFRNAYDKAYSIEDNKPITPEVQIGASPLKVTYIAFGTSDSDGKLVTDFNQPLRKSAMKYVLATVDVESSKKGLFKLGMKIINPDGKAMVATKGVDYSSTSNVEIKKVNKAQACTFAPYGSESENFWKAGEYTVEIYDFEVGAKLHTTTFNIL